MSLGRVILSLTLILSAVPFFLLAWRLEARGEQDRLIRNEDDPPSMANPYDTDAPTFFEFLASVVGMIGIGLIAAGGCVYVSG